jgi:DNA-directed RNA polymerase specialized sigma subunit
MDVATQRAEALDWVLAKVAAAKKPQPLPLPGIKAHPKVTKEQKRKELELWKKWMSGGQKPKDLEPLLKSLSPMIFQRASKFRSAEVPYASIVYQHKKALVNALPKWDPKKGALSTYMERKLMRPARFVEKYKNPARIPENISKYIGSVNAVKAELTENLGHEPTAQDIWERGISTKHDVLKKASLRDIQRALKEQRKSFISTGHDAEETGPSPILSSRAEEVAHLIIPELSSDERIVHAYSLGLEGKPRLSPGDIAKKLKFDSSKVSKLRSSIFRKMRPYLGE